MNTPVRYDGKMVLGVSNAVLQDRLIIIDPIHGLVIGLAFECDYQHHRASFVAVVCEAEKNPIVLVEPAIPFAKSGAQRPSGYIELRFSGLWTTLICETPDRHWSYGLEAFALEIDDPAELLQRGVGHRVPLGWELEFESNAVNAVGANQTGSAHGILQFADRELAIDGDALREHKKIVNGNRQASAVLTWPKLQRQPDTVEVALPMVKDMCRFVIAESGVSWR